jgi:hypothetical protein
VNIDLDDDEEFNEFDDGEYDFLSLAKDFKESYEDVDKSNPKVYEGNLIDRACRKYIASVYEKCKVIDFYDYKYSNKQAFEKTLEIIKHQDNVLLFQPTFIYKDIAIAKPDALVKLEGKYILIETKGTSTTKLSHLVDIQYQVNVIDEVLNKFDENIDNCKLCIVAYEKRNKGEITFLLTEYCNYQKSGKTLSENEKKIYSDKFADKTISIKEAYKTGTHFENRIIDFVHGKIDKFVKYSQLTGENFDRILSELKNATPCEKPRLIPCEQYKSWLKDASHWHLLREYYFINHEYIAFSFSGFLIHYKNALVYGDLRFKNDADFLKKASLDNTNKVFDEFYASFKQTDPNRKYNKICSYSNVTINKFNEIKIKKVYFDFESLNTAIRVIDGTLPYMQAVNQVSVIFDNGDGKLVKKDGSSGSDNIIIDPLTMTINDYKTIIDAIFPKEHQEEYSYIVYNQGFEVTRLKEIRHLLNNKEYSRKIDIIINNIYDLADLFDFHKTSYIYIEELHAFYSIKKVLPLVKKYAHDIYQKTGCKDYKELQIHNGGQAQTESTKRFFNLLNINE